MHPLQTFNGVSVPPLEGKVFAIEGDVPAARVARESPGPLAVYPWQFRRTRNPCITPPALSLQDSRWRWKKQEYACSWPRD